MLLRSSASRDTEKGLEVGRFSPLRIWSGGCPARVTDFALYRILRHAEARGTESESRKGYDSASVYPAPLWSICGAEQQKFPKGMQIESCYQKALPIEQHAILKINESKEEEVR